MTTPYRPSWGTSAGTGTPDRPDLRVSDAERAEVAEQLSRHFGDGRLDQDEFNERLDRAMSAKTRADLAGLFAGLPGPEPVPAAVAAPARRYPHPPQTRHPVLLLVVVLVIASIVAQALVVPHIPWLLVALVAFLWLRHRRHHRL